MKINFLFCSIFAFSMSYGQYTDQINSNRPGKSFGAYSIGKTVIQAEAGTYYAQEKHELLDQKASGFGLDLALRYGALLEELEFIGEVQYQSDKMNTPFDSYKRNGFKNLTVGAKYLIYDPWKKYVEKHNVYSWKANKKVKWRNLIPTVGVYAGANFNVGDNPYSFPTDASVSPKIMLLLQNHLAPQWVLVTNVIADKITTDFPSYGYILTLTRGINPKWSAFIENQGYMSDFYSDNIVRGGAAYLLADNMQIDASAGVNFKDTPGIFNASIGFSWRFDKKYKPVEINSTKDSKDKSKDPSKGEKRAEEFKAE